MSGEKQTSEARRPGTVARSFHEATKHSFESVRQRGHSLRWDNKPNPFKVIAGSDRLQLPRDFAASGVTVLEAVGGGTAPPSPKPLDLLELARLLLVGAGVRRRMVYPDGEEFFFRTYASAGALYPVEIYVVSSNLNRLNAGVYHFDPSSAALERVREGDHRGHVVRAAGGQPAVADAPVTMVLTGIPWRTAWKYTERGYRHLFWDAGMILANLLALASAAALPAKPIMGFVDDEVEALLGLERAREFPLCLLAVGSGSPVEPAQSPPEPVTYPFPLLSRRELEYPAIGEVNDAGRLATPEDAVEWRDRALPERAAGSDEGPDTQTFPSAAAPPPPDSIEDVIRRRGSARGFARGSVPLGVLARVLEAATGGIATDLAPRSITDVYLVANAVDGLEPGAYFYDSGSFELLQRGDFRRRAAYLCLEQRLAGDAAVTLFLLTDLVAALEMWGDRGYRVAQLETGTVAGKIYLGAYGYGYGATGLNVL